MLPALSATPIRQPPAISFASAFPASLRFNTFSQSPATKFRVIQGSASRMSHRKIGSQHSAVSEEQQACEVFLILT
jgi:hypothetical protein